MRGPPHPPSSRSEPEVTDAVAEAPRRRLGRRLGRRRSTRSAAAAAKNAAAVVVFRTRRPAPPPSSAVVLLLLLSSSALSSILDPGAPSTTFAADAFAPRSFPSSAVRRSSAAFLTNDDASIPYLHEPTYSDSDGDNLQQPDGDGDIMSPLRRLVLVGGGHGHVQVIKALNRSARPRNLHVTLIDVQEDASYSGMVPGCVSGLYAPEETLIRLRPLAEWAGIEFVRDEVIDVDPVGRKLYLRGGEHGNGAGGGGTEGKGKAGGEENYCVEYDAVSFDIGSASRGLDDTPGARERCIPTRPISDLVRRIDEAGRELQEDITAGKCDDGSSATVVLIGGGAAGIELSMAMRARWGPLFGDGGEDSAAEKKLRITLLDSGDELLPSETAPCREALRGVLARRGVDVRHGSSVREIGSDLIRLEDGTELPYTHCLWATGAASHPLADVMSRRGIATTDRGWIRVSPTLQSVSYPSIFAAGDCCHIEDLEGGKSSPPKAGVYAVRSGPILVENLTRYLKNNDNDKANGEDAGMTRYAPQDDFLKLIMCGDGSALGFRFGIPLEGKWVWNLKDRIDTMFMDLFDAEKLSPLQPVPQDVGGGDRAESGGDGDGDDDDDGDGDGDDDEGKYDTAQYDAAEEKWGSLPAGEAAELLRRTDDGVDYKEAWHVLRDMMGDDSYRVKVLEAVATAALSEKEVVSAVPT